MRSRLFLVHTVLICSLQRTGRACCDKMFLLVHAWRHTRGRFVLAWNLPASGGNSFPVAFRLFILPLSTLLVWHFLGMSPPSFPNQKHFLFAFGASDIIGFALTSSPYFSPVQLTQNQYWFRDVGFEVGCYSWSSWADFTPDCRNWVTAAAWNRTDVHLGLC